MRLLRRLLPSRAGAQKTENTPTDVGVNVDADVASTIHPESEIHPESDKNLDTDAAQAQSHPSGNNVMVTMRSRWRSMLDPLLNRLRPTQTLSQESLREWETTLIDLDLGPHLARSVLDQCRRSAGETFIQDLESALVDNCVVPPVPHPIWDAPAWHKDKSLHLQEGQKPPLMIISLIGVNGAGKTTALAKLAHHYKQNGLRVVAIAGDTFRAAAGEQLSIWLERVGIELMPSQQKEPAARIYEGLQHARRMWEAPHDSRPHVILIDTAGRLDSRADLMAELTKSLSMIQKLFPESRTWGDDMDSSLIKGDHVRTINMLVVDAGTGQHLTEQAYRFAQQIPLVGVIANKLDGSSRGGCLFALGPSTKANLAILALGTGEGIGDLIPFEALSFTRQLLGKHT